MWSEEKERKALASYSTPQTLIQKLHTILIFQDSYLQGTPAAKVTPELN